MRHKYYNDGFDTYEEVKNSFSNRGRTMSGFDAHKEEVAPKKEGRVPAWKQGIPTVAGRYFYAEDIKNLDIPRYCTVLKGESWGAEGNIQYTEITFREDLIYEIIKECEKCNSISYRTIRFSKKEEINYIEFCDGADGCCSSRKLYFTSDVEKFWFYGPLDIPKEV